jgi:glycosyltransferase involved in cell wall biosynthesis
MKKVMIFLDSSGFGGIETHVSYLARMLTRYQSEAEIVLWKDYGEHPIEETLSDIHIPISKLDGKIWSLMKAIKSFRPDIVHTHGYKAGIIGRIVCRLMKVRVISTYHAGDTGTGKMRVYTWLDEVTSSLSPSIAVSRDILSTLKGKKYYLQNFIPVPNDWQVVNKNHRVAFVGRLSEEKGANHFIEIARICPDQEFHVYGSGPMENTLKRISPSNVSFHGFISDMDAVWGDIDLLCMPSLNEGTPYAALEAMSRGIPILASDVGGLPDLIDHGINGWCLPIEKPLGFAKKVASWARLEQGERSAMSAAAHYKVSRGYSESAAYSKIMNMYQ